MDRYHIFQVMYLFLPKGGKTHSGDLGYLRALLGVEVGVDTAGPAGTSKNKRGMKNYYTAHE